MTTLQHPCYLLGSVKLSGFVGPVHLFASNQAWSFQILDPNSSDHMRFAAVSHRLVGSSSMFSCRQHRGNQSRWPTTLHRSVRLARTRQKGKMTPSPTHRSELGAELATNTNEVPALTTRSGLLQISALRQYHCLILRPRVQCFLAWLSMYQIGPLARWIDSLAEQKFAFPLLDK